MLACDLLSSFLSFISASQEGRDCSFADPAFVVYSSVASFYVPFIVTLMVYVQICVVLRRRGRRTAPSRRHGLHPEPREGQRSRKVCWESHIILLIFRYNLPFDYNNNDELVTAILFHCFLSLCVFQNKCTHPEDVKLCTLIVKPPPAAPQRKKVVKHC